MKHINVAIPTPFDENENLRVETFEPIIDYLQTNGVASILVSGSTGEQHSMSIDERIQIIQYFNRTSFADVELLFGVAATRLKDAVRLMKAVEDSAFDGVFLGFPPYIRPTQEQAVFYVDELAKQTKKEIALYNNPARTGFDLSPEALLELTSKHSHIVGLKEGGDVGRYENKHLPKHFIMFAAGDVNFPEKIKNGCNGLSSMVANVYPKEIIHGLKAIQNQEEVDLRALQQLIEEVTGPQTIQHIKRHYENLGMQVGPCRAPL
ncbi:dihydrodipicolinate synthase family protein [Alteribacillus iranensis]|uniref:4-hydroxy-tetrahydrodipicolinate synthase n=1 Tax=Alteribacillus iranensis TaxID=930128 RepID=A0A1I2D682_9BACI|nr:dihydrodipicolinate synthase family protein [Alteribacillus iranensis]SFE75573.1 4-hydroxy-tetrahydrodipicolinate synthase [Alteribacillus iranensis]